MFLFGSKETSSFDKALLQQGGNRQLETSIAELYPLLICQEPQ